MTLLQEASEVGQQQAEETIKSEEAKEEKAESGTQDETNSGEQSGEQKGEPEKQTDSSQPEWLKTDKYKTVEDQAKAYVDLEKKLGAFKGAPDEYDLKIEDHPEVELASDDPLLKPFLDRAKEMGVSQEYMSELLGTYVNVLTANQPDSEKEMAELGTEAKPLITSLSRWASENLSEDEYQTLSGMMNTAKGIRLLKKFRDMASADSVAPPSKKAESREKLSEVRKLVHDPRYDTDEGFRKDVERRMTEALDDERKYS